MKIKILGAGWYGLHIAKTLLGRGHDVEIHELASEIFAGASGGNPARLHLGLHYPRSQITRVHCQEHNSEFMSVYGKFTSCVPANVYAIADHSSLVDFGTYRQILKSEIELITIDDPKEFGLRNVEGAVLCGERHIVIDKAKKYFSDYLNSKIVFNSVPEKFKDKKFDFIIDCTFCAQESAGIDRYEPCLTVILEGPCSQAVTIMDGPFPSIYPWDESNNLLSLTSAKYTPLIKCDNWPKAKSIVEDIDAPYIKGRSEQMFGQMASYWPASADLFKIVGHKLSIRAMQKSSADARLVDVIRLSDNLLRVRAGKIDAIFHAGRLVTELVEA